MNFLVKSKLSDHSLSLLTKSSNSLYPSIFLFVTKLILDFNQISNGGISYLSSPSSSLPSQPFFPNLQHLSLNSNKIGNEGCVALIDCNWKQLKILWLRSCRIGNRGCQALNRGNWKKIVDISLEGNRITYIGAMGLLKGNFPMLQFNRYVATIFNANEKNLHLRKILTKGWPLTFSR